ncbi:MAG: dipeptide epimerase [Pseudomonadota bacterium]
MKIDRVEYWTENFELSRPYAIAYHDTEAVENIFVRLSADDGSFGLGVASPAEEVTGEGYDACRRSLEENLDPLVRGADPRTIKSLLRRLGGQMSAAPAALAAVDMALFDLLGKKLNLPLVDILGRCHEALPTSITIGIKSAAESLEETDEYLGRGFRILKVKIGRSLEEDVDRLFQIRERAGRDVLIRVDANQGYSLEQYREFTRRTAPLAIEFVEQPLPAGQVDQMVFLDRETRLRAAADESLLGPADAVKYLHEPRPFGIFNIKLMKCGGISPGLRIAEMAETVGIDLMWGCMDESVVGIAAALHAALASPATRYLDLDGSLDLARDLAEGGFIIRDGIMSPTGGPGLGVTLK